MFGSISNWINTNLPQVPQVNLPNMPNLANLPTMPNLPIIPELFGKKNDGNNTTEATESQKSETEQVNEQKVNETEKVAESSLTDQQQQAQENQDQKSSINPLETAKELGTSAKELLGNTTELLGTTTSNLGNMLFSFGKNASSNVMKTATHLKDVIEKKTIIGDFTKENEKFINEKKNQKLNEEAALPPWVGYNNEEKLKEQILALSTDSRNFMRSPPVGVDFPFDFNVAFPVALATLEEDPNLKDMRFKLVPGKINEETFWRNYFYRVSLIKQSTQLDELNNQTNSVSKENSSESVSTESNSVKSQVNNNTTESLTNNEFVSDSYEQEVNVDEIKSDLKQLKLNNKKVDAELEEAEWDKELTEDLDSISAEELEKEINQMIGKQ